MATYLPTPEGSVVSVHSDFAVVYSVEEAEKLLAIYRRRNLSGHKALENAVAKAKASGAHIASEAAASLATMAPLMAGLARIGGTA